MAEAVNKASTSSKWPKRVITKPAEGRLPIPLTTIAAQHKAAQEEATAVGTDVNDSSDEDRPKKRTCHQSSRSSDEDEDDAPAPVDDNSMLPDIVGLAELPLPATPRIDPTRDCKAFTEEAPLQPGGKNGKIQKRVFCKKCRYVNHTSMSVLEMS
jgi:hypothetical protein